MENEGATATLDQTATNTAPEDEGGRVEVPDSAADAARNEYRDGPETDEQRQERERAAYEQVVAAREGKPRQTDGKFAAKPGKPALKQEPEEETEQTEEKPGAKAEAKAETTEDREKAVAARRALKRDGWTDEEIGELKPESLLTRGARAAERQAKADERFRELQGKAGKPAAEESKPATNAGAQGQDEDAATHADAIPAEVLDYLPENERKALKGHVSRHVEKATKAIEGRLRAAEANLLEERGRSIQRELAADFPALKDEQDPESTFFRKLRQLNAKGQYQIDTYDGLRELMEDTAAIVYGKQAKEQARQEVLATTRKAITAQPDTSTLAPSTKKGDVTREEYERKAFEITKAGGDAASQRAELHKWLGGRAVKD